MEENTIDLRPIIVALRSQTGESQSQFATRLKVALSTIQRYEARNPDIGDVPRLLSRMAALAREEGRDDLADALEVPLRALLTTPGEPEPPMVQMARRLYRIRQSAEERDWQHLMDLVEITERLGKMKK
jgi:transcriptional regulator with XRE-family HTH domain